MVSHQFLVAHPLAEKRKRRRLSTALLTRIASQGSKFLLPSWQGFLCHCFTWCHMMPIILDLLHPKSMEYGWPCVFCCFYVHPGSPGPPNGLPIGRESWIHGSSFFDQPLCLVLDFLGAGTKWCTKLTLFQPELAWTAPSDSTWFFGTSKTAHIFSACRMFFVVSWMGVDFLEKKMWPHFGYIAVFSMFLRNFIFCEWLGFAWKLVDS